MALLQSCGEGYRIGAAARRKSLGEQSDHENVQKMHKIDCTLSVFESHHQLAAFVLAAAARLMK
jgi:hypothetical protein